MEHKKGIIRSLCIIGLLQILVIGVLAAPISYGDYVNGTINTPATWDTYKFSGTTGEPAYLRLKTSWPFNGQIRMYAPNGTMIASPSGMYGTELTMILPVTGTYTLLVGDADGGDTGTYDLYLQRTKNPANPILIRYGDYRNGTIPYPALYTTYTFSGTAGDPAYLRLKTSFPFNAQIRMYTPNGTMIASPSGMYGTEMTMILPVTGTYTLLVGDADGGDTGTYDLYLQRTKNPANPIPISDDETLHGVIAHPALWDTYTFNALCGDVYVIRLKTSWPFDGQIRMYAPNGTMIASPSGMYGTELTMILPVTGTYSLLVGDDDGGDTGTYDLYLMKIGTNHVTAAFSASPKSGTLPLVVDLKDESSSTPTKWNWSFGDGSYSTEQNPEHTYTCPGTFNVSLTASNEYCPDTLTKERYITVTVPVLPGCSNPPTDPDGDGIYEDLNGNGRLDFADVVLYFNQMKWIKDNKLICAFDLNGNGRIDFADIVALFNEI